MEIDLRSTYRFPFKVTSARAHTFVDVRVLSYFSMQRALTLDKIRQLMRHLARSVKSNGKVYFTGGSTALLLGIRAQTIDVDLSFDPEPRGIFEALARLKEKLDINVELACPSDFIPPLPKWRERSILIETLGKISFYHYDLYSQALAKLERGHTQDLEDVTQFVKRGLVDPERLLPFLAQIKPKLIRYPAIDVRDFERRVKSFLEKIGKR